MSYRTLVLILATLLAAPAFAEEIVHFKNGTTMAIRSHNIEDGMVHVDMGADALMAFPVSQIDKIVVAGKNVFLQPSSRRANVGVGGGDVKVETTNPNNIYPAFSSAPASSRRAGGSVSSPSSGAGKSNSGSGTWQAVGGSADDNPFQTRARLAAPNHPNRSARQMTVVGRKPQGVSADGSVPFGANQNQRRLVTSRSQLAKPGEYPGSSSISPKSGLGTTPSQRGESAPASGASSQDSSGSDN